MRRKSSGSSHQTRGPITDQDTGVSRGEGVITAEDPATLPNCEQSAVAGEKAPGHTACEQRKENPS